MDKETPISFDHLLLLWEKAFLDLVPVALNASGWTSDGKPVTSGDARIALAAAWADLVITEHAKRFAPQSNAANEAVDKEIAASPCLLAELQHAHQIILNAVAIMTPEQLSAWAQANELDGCDGDGATRYHERAEVIAKATGGQS